MDMTKSRLTGLGKGNIAKAFFLSLVVAAVFAAAVFFPNNQPFGYISPPAMSSGNFSKGNAIAYTPGPCMIAENGVHIASSRSQSGYTSRGSISPPRMNAHFCQIQ